MSDHTFRLTSAIESIIKEYVEEAMSNADRIINADCVDGLETFVNGVIDDRLDDVEVDVDNVKGLANLVDESVADAFDNNIDEAVLNILNNDGGIAVSPIAVAAALTSKEVEEALDTAIAKSILRVLKNILSKDVPVAHPV